MAFLKNLTGGVSRRELFGAGGALAALGLTRGAAAGQAAGAAGANIYESIGVRPLINCRGTYTIISGSLKLPEVNRAMEQAALNFVNMDELAEAVGKRLAEITGAEWGMVSAGCCAAMAHATAACVAGSDPEKMQRLPNCAGMKSEVVIPGYSRNVYDHAIRMVGVKIVTVARKEDFAAAFTSQTAMVYMVAGPEDSGPFGLPFILEVAHAKGVPVLVDAAADDLTIPNVYLQKGADLVCYSGGKALRGPQCAGMLLGNKSIVQAAWINSAPHHAYGRAMKVGKEEIMGMLAAVETWAKTDHEAEYKRKRGYLEYIGERVSKIPGVKTSIRDARGLSDRAASLSITWDPAQLGITGPQVSNLLYEGNPRIDNGGGGRGGSGGSLTVIAHMMMPGEEEIVGERVFAILSKPPKLYTPSEPAAAAGNVNGRWDVHVEYSRGVAEHGLALEQQGNRLLGTHYGELLSGDLQGSLEGDRISMRSSHRYEGTSIGYAFTGTVAGDSMRGVLSVGEYGEAKWTARRHPYGQGRRRG